MKKLKNVEIKESLKKNGVFQYELAEKMGVSEFTLVKRFRKEQSEEETKRIISLIDEIAKEREAAYE